MTTEPPLPGAPTPEQANEEETAPPSVRERPGRAPAGELTSALSALALLVTMFALKWYGIVALPHSADRSGIQGAVSAWTELSVIRWLMLIAAIVTIGSVVIHIGQRSHGRQTNTSTIVTTVGALTALALVYRVLVNLPKPHSVIDAKLGAYLGLLAATGIALGGYESMLAHRRMRRVASRRRRAPRAEVAADTPAR